MWGKPRGKPGALWEAIPKAILWKNTEDIRDTSYTRVRLLERLGLHRRVLELPELAVEGDTRLGPQRLHQRKTLGEPRNVPLGIHAEGSELAPLAAGADADVDPAAAQLVQRAHGLRQMHGAVQGGHENHAPQSHPLGARGGVGHRFDRPELRPRTQGPFL